ncbi:hypothetical protein FCH28_29445 [Streptomyces piniterrae]|uniref:Secreted protein n=1 Tax=Streptomyces piniterrae TaxID=2571125 RepID=A0A4U0N4F9_9ACTN|nr:hypothetical protein [Streptomyces piniterrae]TJZ44474.1 hypothetical protein FCH28_29445 [Streptomyces piniterrae]
MRPRTVYAALASAIVATGATLALAPAASATRQHGPTPQEFVDGGGIVKICTRGTLFDGMVNLGCRAPHSLTPATTWRDLREEEDAVAPMLCKPSLVNKASENTEVAALGAGLALQCTPVPQTWGP